MTLKRAGNAAVIVKLNMAAIWTKWRYNNFLSDNWQGKGHMSIMENGMYNNVAAILNSDMAAILWRQFQNSKYFPRYKVSLFSFQSTIGSEIQTNVKHMVDILKSNMAVSAHDVNSDIAKMFLDIGIYIWILVLGLIEQENMAASSGRELLGVNLCYDR